MKAFFFWLYSGKMLVCWKLTGITCRQFLVVPVNFPLFWDFQAVYAVFWRAAR